MMRVTAAILWRAGKVLLARRTRPPWLAGKWEFPGGKIEPGESSETCLARELVEELGIQVEVGPHFMNTVHAYPELTLELVVHEVLLVSGEPTPREHDRLAWVPPEELESYDLAPADLPIAARLADRGAPADGPG
ncbi:MAG: (deoxy)nucleoside triphosphate pyrophosphohydrolase [Planctomycetota bacterium]